MPIVADAVKAERLAVAEQWVADNWAAEDLELVYSSATGYYVPKKYRSKSPKDIEDEDVLNLMKAQGYKPRAKKSPPPSVEPIVLLSDESLSTIVSSDENTNGNTNDTADSCIQKLVKLLEKWDVQGIKVTVVNNTA
jgi:hypothetical protein